MTNIRRALEAAAAGGGDKTYVEDVFSTYLFTANGSTGQTITNGIDLAGEGGLVWHKDRVATYGHVLWDTARGNDVYLNTAGTGANQTSTDSITFNADGYDLNAATGNEGTNATVGWTFRKAPGFFDVVTYTGNSTAGRTISHSLGSVPGCIIVKKTSASESWGVYHRSASASPEEGYLRLNDTDAYAVNSGYWNDTAPTSTEFTLGANPVVNTDTETYVAYLFANDDQSFGADSDESIIKCGSFTTTATWGNYKEDLGWEPQYVLMKRADSSSVGDWFIIDSMRGIVGPGDGTLADTSAFYNQWQTSDDAELKANTSAIETEQGRGSLYATGIIGAVGVGNADFIYIAIRRPMKVPEAGTEVYLAQTANSTNPGPLFSASFPVDMVIWKENLSAAGTFRSGARLLQGSYGVTNDTSAWAADSAFAFDYSYGWRGDYGVDANNLSWMFSRATGFMDVVTQVGDGVGGASWNHNLGVVPEMIIGKNRTDAVDWAVYHHGVNGGVDPADYQLQLNDDAAQYDYNGYWDDVLPTTTHFTTGGSTNTNQTGKEYIFYLFTTLAGVSKVGSYTADATLTTIDCGFSAGARFVLIKRVDAVGDWYLYDSVRGIVAGNDPYARPNEALAQVTGTDYIDPDSSGFQLTAAGSSTINVDTGTYIFLAIA